MAAARALKIMGVLSKAHRLRLLTEICERKVVSSSELVVACGILPPQAFRALDELEKHGLAERERKEPEGGRPYVFWYPTDLGQKTLEWLNHCPAPRPEQHEQPRAPHASRVPHASRAPHAPHGTRAPVVPA